MARRPGMRTFRGAIVAMVILGGGGCGDDPAPPAATCGGDGCTCTGSACACVAGMDCHVECGDLACSLDCTMDTKCNAMSNAAVTLECHDTSECKGNGGPNSSILCDQMANCDLKAE